MSAWYLSSVSWSVISLTPSKGAKARDHSIAVILESEKSSKGTIYALIDSHLKILWSSITITISLKD